MDQTRSRLTDFVLSLGFDAFVLDLKKLEGGTESRLDDNHTFINDHLIIKATIIINHCPCL